MIDRQTFHLRPDGEKAFGYAQAVRSGSTLHISGSLSVDDAFRPEFPGDMAAQIASVYAAIGRTLDAFGATMANVVKENIYVADMDAFIAANGARISHYAGLDLPATTAVEVRRLAFPECMIEIEITASLSPREGSMPDSLADGFVRPLHCQKAVRLPAPADAVWALVGNIGDETIGKGLVERIEVIGDGVGALRLLHLPGGGLLHERIEEYSETDRYYVYRVIDSGPLNFTNYLAMARVTPAGPDACILSWNTQAQAVSGFEDQTQAILQGNIDYICMVLTEHFKP